ncbi:hypothetical protein A200_00905 [Parascardovia denticolens IPLA 20019]|uniref:DUF805 domain-containing protein n=1 Tax=Parascardovia denticolens TaxID=78258 RepID=UPI000266BACD|nr:DUF805 domain-containing protein [Parascardovia denticolens]EIT89014.1 hypothetical protein A200_00905 [Parascardovia denticolens IPLA 20019]
MTYQQDPTPADFTDPAPEDGSRQAPFENPEPASQPAAQSARPNDDQASGAPAGTGMPVAPAPYPSDRAFDVPLGLPWYGVPFGKAIKRFFKKYATFSGRASRSEYWLVVLFNALVYVGTIILFFLLSFAAGMTFDKETGSNNVFVSFIMVILAIALVVYSLACLVPSIAIIVRRLHDSNHSGWWLLGYVVAKIVMGITASIVFISWITSLMHKYGAELESGIDTNALPSGVEADIVNSLMGFLGTYAIFGILDLALGITLLVFLCLPPRIEGQRFDRPEDNPNFFIQQTQMAYQGFQPYQYPAQGYQQNGYQPNGYQAGGYQVDGYQANGYQADGYQAMNPPYPAAPVQPYQAPQASPYQQTQPVQGTPQTNGFSSDSSFPSADGFSSTMDQQTWPPQSNPEEALAAPETPQSPEVPQAPETPRSSDTPAAPETPSSFNSPETFPHEA